MEDFEEVPPNSLRRSLARRCYQPAPRACHSTVVIGDNLYLWGKEALTTKATQGRSSMSKIDIFNLLSAEWKEKQTKGIPPMGTSAYAVTSIGTNIYYFGGFCSDKRYDNSLNVLDVEDSLTWRNINGQDTCTTEAVTAPIKKSYCGMIDIGDKMVLVVGGRGMVPSTKHPDFQYIEGREGCMTNEQHICQLDSGQWVLPSVIGQLPPCAGFSITKLPGNKALLIGKNHKKILVLMVTVDGHSLTWEEVTNSKSCSADWLLARTGHTATLISNSLCMESTFVAVMGGMDTSGRTLNNFWILELTSSKHYHISLIKHDGRMWHSVSSYYLTPTCVWLVAYGGLDSNNQNTATDFPSICGDTNVMELIYQEREWKAEEILLEDYQHKVQTRLLESRKWLQNMSITSKVTDTSAIVELSSLKEQLEQNQINYEKQLSKLTLELKEVRSDRDRISIENEVMSQKLHSKENSIQGSKELIDVRDAEENVDSQRFAVGRISSTRTRNKSNITKLEDMKETQDMLASKAKELEEKDLIIQKPKEYLVNSSQSMTSTHPVESDCYFVLEDHEIDNTREIQHNGNSQNAVYKGLQVTAQSVRVHDYNAWITSEEVRLGAQLHHPNIQLFFGVMRSKPIVISEFMPTSLHQELMEAKNKMEKITVLSIGEEIAVALNYLHHYRPQAIVYGSLTSSNVLLEPSSSKSKWKAKLSNFCSAMSVQVYDQNRYEAPECFQEETGSPAKDVYSLGILLLEMRRPHFKIQEKDQIIRKFKWVPLKNVIVQCIKTDHLQRPPIAHIVSELKEIDAN